MEPVRRPVSVGRKRAAWLLRQSTHRPRLRRKQSRWQGERGRRRRWPGWARRRRRGRLLWPPAPSRCLRKGFRPSQHRPGALHLRVEDRCIEAWEGPVRSEEEGGRRRVHTQGADLRIGQVSECKYLLTNEGDVHTIRKVWVRRGLSCGERPSLSWRYSRGGDNRRRTDPGLDCHCN